MRGLAIIHAKVIIKRIGYFTTLPWVVTFYIFTIDFFSDFVAQSRSTGIGSPLNEIGRKLCLYVTCLWRLGV